MWSHASRALERKGPKLAAIPCPSFLRRWGPRPRPKPGIRWGKGARGRARPHPMWNRPQDGEIWPRARGPIMLKNHTQSRTKILFRAHSSPALMSGQLQLFLGLRGGIGWHLLERVTEALLEAVPSAHPSVP